jgi:uncharacterized protein (TIGR02265 family)
MPPGDVRIKGAVLKARLALIEQIAPGKGLPAVLGRLTAEDGEELRSVLATKWYPFDLGSRLDAAIVAELGGGRAEFFERLGAASAEQNLHGVHKHFLVEGDPQAFLSRAPMIYEFYYDQGRRDYEQTGPREAVLTTHDAEVFSVPDCATVVGWYRRALEMCGARNPRVVEEECRARGGRVCRYRLSWDDSV